MDHTYREAYLYLMDQLTYEIERLKSIQQGAEEIFINSDEFDWEFEEEARKESGKS